MLYPGEIFPYICLSYNFIKNKGLLIVKGKGKTIPVLALRAPGG